MPIGLLEASDMSFPECSPGGSDAGYRVAVTGGKCCKCRNEERYKERLDLRRKVFHSASDLGLILKDVIKSGGGFSESSCCRMEVVPVFVAYAELLMQ